MRSNIIAGELASVAFGRNAAADGKDSLGGGGGAGGAGWIVVPASARASILIGARARASDAASEL